MTTSNLEILKESLISDINKRVEDKIIEKENADLIIKLINQAEDQKEANAIAMLGTTYKRTGFHFDKRLEIIGDEIRYLKKIDSLSFKNDDEHITHELIIGDNYDALLNLEIKYNGMIDVIYIDPPYGKDDMGEFADTNYNNAITRDNLLSMLYPRLQIAKRLLNSHGTIFCSIDDKNQAYIKCLFDEIFGENNFLGNIHWRRRNNQPNDKTKLIGIVAEHILVYSKNTTSLKNYGIGKVKSTGVFSNPDNDPNGNWASKPWKTGTNQTGTRYKIVSPCGEVFDEEWMGTEETYKELLDKGAIYFTNNGHGLPRKKYYQNDIEKEGQCAANWWGFERYGSNQDGTNEMKAIFGQENLFKNPKPTKLISNILNLGCVNKEAIILDFFAGTGTTAHATMELNRQDGGHRKCILCTNNEKSPLNRNGIAIDVTTRRLKRIMCGMDYNGDNNFEWLENNTPYLDNLNVYEIDSIANMDPDIFSKIDEAAYGLDRFNNTSDKIEWVCKNFEKTQKNIKEDNK